MPGGLGFPLKLPYRFQSHVLHSGQNWRQLITSKSPLRLNCVFQPTTRDWSKGAFSANVSVNCSSMNHYRATRADTMNVNLHEQRKTSQNEKEVERGRDQQTGHLSQRAWGSARDENSNGNSEVPRLGQLSLGETRTTRRDAARVQALKRVSVTALRDAQNAIIG